MPIESFESPENVLNRYIYGIEREKSSSKIKENISVPSRNENEITDQSIQSILKYMGLDQQNPLISKEEYIRKLQAHSSILEGKIEKTKSTLKTYNITVRFWKKLTGGYDRDEKLIKHLSDIKNQLQIKQSAVLKDPEIQYKAFKNTVPKELFSEEELDDLKKDGNFSRRLTVSQDLMRLAKANFFEKSKQYITKLTPDQLSFMKSVLENWKRFIEDMSGQHVHLDYLPNYKMGELEQLLVAISKQQVKLASGNDKKDVIRDGPSKDRKFSPKELNELEVALDPKGAQIKQKEQALRASEDVNVLKDEVVNGFKVVEFDDTFINHVMSLPGSLFENETPESFKTKSRQRLDEVSQQVNEPILKSFLQSYDFALLKNLREKLQRFNEDCEGIKEQYEKARKLGITPHPSIISKQKELIVRSDTIKSEIVKCKTQLVASIKELHLTPNSAKKISAFVNETADAFELIRGRIEWSLRLAT